MTEMLDYVKAISNPDRLRIIGLLSQESATRSQVAERLNLPLKDSSNHLDFLEQAGVVAQADGVFTLDSDKLAVLGRDQLAGSRPSFAPPAHFDEKSQKILRAVINANGSIIQIPEQAAKFRVVLDYLIPFFEFDKDYTEKEVNLLLRRFNEDTALLRRGLVDENLLARESNGSRYWRVK